MEIITSFYDNYKEAMRGLHDVAKVLITAATIFVLAGVIMAIVNFLLVSL